MKSVSSNKKIKYPVMAEYINSLENNDGPIILFTSKHSGLVVKAGCGAVLGEYSTKWSSIFSKVWRILASSENVVLTNS